MGTMKASERYKDIMPMDQWPGNSALGSHRNPQRPPGKQLVLLVRGDVICVGYRLA